MTVTELAIKRPRLILVIYIIIGILGIYGYNNLNYELLPEVTPPYVSVITVYPGASPKEVETSVTKPIEDAVSGVNKIKRVFASSSEGVSFVFVEFLQSADANIALQDVQRKVNEIVATLPKDIKTPTIMKFSINELPILRLGATATLPATEFYQLLKDRIKPAITKLDGVAQVVFVGGEEREIKINVSLDRLNYYNISILQVMQAIKTSNLDFPVGTIKDKDGQYIVRVSSKFKSLEEIKNIPIITLPNSGTIKISDVAEVEDGIKEIETITRINKKISVGILINKQTDANAVEVSKIVRNELSKLEQEYQKYNLKFEIASDGSEFTLEAARAVNEDLLLAIILVAIVMLIFLHSLRNSFIVLVAIPASFATTFVAMWALGFTLNLMTLLALSLVIGILVDDSIVVLENIHRHLEMGKDKKKAALDGRNEIGFSALSITLVDVVVFVPISLISGLVGNILRQFALVVVVSTLSSLVVSFTLTPMFASRLSKVNEIHKNSFWWNIANFFETQFERLTNHYLRILKWALKSKGKVIAISTALLISSLMLLPLGFIGAEFMTPSDRGELSVIIEYPERFTLQQNNELTQQAESIILAMPEVKRVFTNVGYANDNFITTVTNNKSELLVSLVDKTKRKKSVNEVSREIKEKLLQIPGLKPRVTPVGIFGMSEGSPIMVVVNGSDYDKVYQTAQKVKAIVASVRGTRDVRTSSQDGKPEYQIKLDRDKMSQLGLSTDIISYALRTAYTGDDESKFRPGGNEEYNIRIILDKVDRNNTEKLKTLKFVNNQGHLIELQQFATIEQSIGPSVLERKNRNSSITIFSQADGRPSGDIGNDIKELIEKANIPSDITITYEGDLEIQEDSFSDLLIALIVAIIFVYLIMVALYDSWLYPFVVLFSVPLAIIGALYGLALMMKTLTIFSILGIIMLVGLVAKNAILLVDRANQMRAEGLSAYDALIDAGKTRIRPIIMTTAAMVFGMLPIALSISAGSEIKSGLATAIVGGLISSLFLTLILVPVVYLKVEEWREKFSMKIKSKLNSKPITIIFFLLLFSNNAFAQNKGFTLDSVISYAIKNNIELKNARMNKFKTDEQVREAYANAYPNLSASAMYMRSLKKNVFYMPGIFFGKPGVNVPVEIGSDNSYSLTFELSQPLFSGAINAGIRAAKVVNEMSNEIYENKVLELKKEVKKAYYNILILEEQKKLVQQSYERAKQRFNDVKVLYRQDYALEVDTLTAYVAMQNIYPNIIKLDNAIKNSKSYLKLLMNYPDDSDFVLLDKLQFPNNFSEFDFETSYNFALQNRKELSILELQSKATDELINAEFAGHLPTVALFGQYKVMTEQNNFKFSHYYWPNSAFVGINISIPIFSGFKVSSKVEQAKIEKDIILNNIDNLKRALKTEIKVAKSKVDEANLNLKVTYETVQYAERNYKLVESRFKKGLSKLSDLQDAELLLNQAKTNYLQELYNYIVAIIEYEWTMGRK